MMYNRGDTTNRAIMMERAGINQATPATTTNPVPPPTTAKPIVAPANTTSTSKI